MDPVTVATISGIAGAMKATIDAALAILSKVKGRDAEKAAKDALALVSELNTRLLQLQEIAFRLHREKAEAVEENAQLRAEIRQEKERTADRQLYQRQQVGKSWVLVRADQPGTYFCEVCLESKGQGIPLTELTREFNFAGTHKCPSCKGYFRYG